MKMETTFPGYEYRIRPRLILLLAGRGTRRLAYHHQFGRVTYRGGYVPRLARGRHH